MTKKKSGAPRPHTPVHAKPLPNKTEGGIIAAKLSETSLFKKPLPTVEKETNKGDTVS